MSALSTLLVAALLTAGDPDKTLLEVELLAPRGQLGLASRNWTRTFDDLGYRVRIRSKLPGDEAAITERTRGTLRMVKAVGELRRDGTIEFPGDRTFSAGTSSELSRFLDALRVYGAAGDPSGSSGWGLTAASSADLETRLARRAVQPTDQTGMAVARMLGDVTGLNVTIDEAGTEYAFETCKWPLNGLATGTTASLALETIGLGFYPVRLPSGATELVITLHDPSKTWPPGWRIPRGTPPAQYLPGLFATTEMPLDDTALEEFLLSMTATTRVALIPLRGELDAQKPDWGTTLIAGGMRPIAPILPITRTIRGAGLTREYRLDDNGLPFVLIRVQDPRRPLDNPVEPPPALALRLRRLAGEE